MVVVGVEGAEKTGLNSTFHRVHRSWEPSPTLKHSVGEFLGGKIFLQLPKNRSKDETFCSWLMFVKTRSHLNTCVCLKLLDVFIMLEHIWEATTLALS